MFKLGMLMYLCLAIFLLLAIGWVWNIVLLVNLPMHALTHEIVIRGLGVVLAPLGGVLGFVGSF